MNIAASICGSIGSILFLTALILMAKLPCGADSAVPVSTGSTGSGTGSTTGIDAVGTMVSSVIVAEPSKLHTNRIKSRNLFETTPTTTTTTTKTTTQRNRRLTARISQNARKNINNVIEGTDDTKYDFVTQSIEHLGWKNPDAAMGNPLKGFMSYPEFSGYNPFIAESIVDISLEAYYIGLDELMIGNNTFDWDPLERRLNDASTRNRHVVLSIICHYPNWHKLSVPQYILDDGLELFYYPDFLGGGYSPNYGDTKLLNALEQFVTAFGEMYDGDDRIGFINLGLLGFWGEWHTYPHDYVPEHAKQSVVSWYRNAFQTTKILARYPLKAAYDAGFGLLDGSFTYETIDGEANGNEVREHYFWPSVVHSGQTDFWKSAPMGGETRPEQQPIVFEPWYPRRTYQKQDFLECVSTTHTTFMAHHDLFINEGYRDEKLENTLHAHARMGYNFMISKVGVLFPDSLSEESFVQIDVKIEQVGVAPFYFPLSLFLDCPDINSPIEIGGIESLINEGDSKVVSFRNVPRTLKCMKAVQFHLNSTRYGLRNRPIKFAQGQHGIVELRIPLPSSLNEEPNSATEPYIVYNLIDINVNVGKSVAELKSGTSIDLARVGRAVTLQVDYYSSNLELQTENVTVEFHFNGRVHREHRYPFLLAGHRGDVYARSLYISSTGIKTVRTIVFDKDNESILLDSTILITVVDSTIDMHAISPVPVPAPMMTRSISEVFAKYLFVTTTPTTSPVPAAVAPATGIPVNYFSDSSVEIHGFNTPSTPPLLMLEERRRRMEFRYHVTIPIVSLAVVILLSLLSCLLCRRSRMKRIQATDAGRGDLVHDGVHKTPI